MATEPVLSSAANAPLDTGTPNTAQPVIAPSGGTMGAPRAAGIPIDVRVLFEYDKIRNMILILIAALAGVSLLMLFINYLIEK